MYWLIECLIIFFLSPFPLHVISRCYPYSEWSSDGCWLLEHNKSHTLCNCNHLTSFALLMDINSDKLCAVYMPVLLTCLCHRFVQIDMRDFFSLVTTYLAIFCYDFLYWILFCVSTLQMHTRFESRNSEIVISFAIFFWDKYCQHFPCLTSLSLSLSLSLFFNKLFVYLFLYII